MSQALNLRDVPSFVLRLPEHSADGIICSVAVMNPAADWHPRRFDARKTPEKCRRGLLSSPPDARSPRAPGQGVPSPCAGR